MGLEVGSLSICFVLEFQFWSKSVFKKMDQVLSKYFVRVHMSKHSKNYDGPWNGLKYFRFRIKARPLVVVILFRKKEVQIVGLRLKKKIQLGCFFTGQKYLANNQVFCGRFNLTTAIKLLLMRPTQVLCPPG